MIKEKTGERVERKTMVCTQCINVMTPTDYTQHNGVCQLCRNETVSGNGMSLYIIYYTYEDDSEPYIGLRVAPSSQSGEVEESWREQSDSIYDYVFVHEVASVQGHDIIIRPTQ